MSPDQNLTEPLPEHHKHEAPPPAQNPYRIWVIVLAIIIGLALIAFLVWFFAPPRWWQLHSDLVAHALGDADPDTHADAAHPRRRRPRRSRRRRSATARRTTRASRSERLTPPRAPPACRWCSRTRAAPTARSQGYPTVEFVGDGNGTQIGAAPRRTPPAPRPISWC